MPLITGFNSWSALNGQANRLDDHFRSLPTEIVQSSQVYSILSMALGFPTTFLELSVD